MRIFQRLNKKLHLYTSLDKLKILSFWAIIKEKNILLLDFDYFNGKKYTAEQQNEIESLWFRLYDEYFLLTNDNKSKFELNKSFSELKIRDKITQIKNNFDFLSHLKAFKDTLDITSYEQETYERLKKIEPKIRLKYFEGIDENLIVLDRVMKSLINQYNIEHKQNETKIEKEIKNVYEVVANAEDWLERSIPIDDMVVTHWIAVRNRVIEKQKAQQQKNKKNGRK